VAWAPDANRYLFWSDVGLGLSVASLASGKKSTVIPGWLILDATWSPDGQWIAALRRRGKYGERSRRPWFYAIYAVRPDGRQLHRVTPWAEGVSGYGDPTWSPDSRRLLFVQKALLWFVTVQTSKITLIHSTGYVLNAAWSPDGKKIAYTRSRLPRFGTPRDFQGVWIIAPNGTGRRQLTTGMQLNPAWSPDGLKIAFTDLVENTDSGPIYTIGVVGAVTGQKTSIVTESDASDEFPSWSPDGTLLSYSHHLLANETDELTLWTVGADGTNPTQVSGSLYLANSSAWRPATR
jgi:Tol biopolymer transport system component